MSPWLSEGEIREKLRAQHDYGTWFDKLREGGCFDISVLKRGEEIEIDTGPAIYYFKMFDKESSFFSVHSETDTLMPDSPESIDFGPGFHCRFVGSILRSNDDTSWNNASVKIAGCLVNGFCPVFFARESFIVLPEVLQIFYDSNPMFDLDI